MDSVRLRGFSHQEFRKCIAKLASAEIVDLHYTPASTRLLGWENELEFLFPDGDRYCHQVAFATGVRDRRAVRHFRHREVQDADHVTVGRHRVGQEFTLVDHIGLDRTFGKLWTVAVTIMLMIAAERATIQLS